MAKNSGLNRQPLNAVPVRNLFDCWTIDILKIGPDKEKNQIIVRVEIFSKWIEIFILKNHNALIKAECSFTLSSRFRRIKSLISDNGGEMKNTIVKHFCQLSGCHKIYGSSSNPLAKD